MFAQWRAMLEVAALCAQKIEKERKTEGGRERKKEKERKKKREREGEGEERGGERKREEGEAEGEKVRNYTMFAKA